MNGGVPMERVESGSLPVLSIRRVVGRTGSPLATSERVPAAAVRGAADTGERLPFRLRSFDASSPGVMHDTLRELEAEPYALEDQRRTGLSDERGAGWT